MLLYLVTWELDKSLAKGKGKISNPLIAFKVLCRNSSDALHCLSWHFQREYDNPKSLTLDDGLISLSRCTIDSRGFTANYLMMDGIREPIYLSDLKSNAIRFKQIFF